eukprot:CAMPEP_0119338816 /NCGR_PEP_ID=MMETSP1333-20130426/96975_1 /TAXON_ID=418940 /ORGANISM="Scyphosphaera apsteinii, Strain RCC1455" /LENGTH=65 /DNA_ID=CAMNT_0007350215 /DNA_START=346 /DNA_END=540 /DNA_ORIENTATION=+
MDEMRTPENSRDGDILDEQNIRRDLRYRAGREADDDSTAIPIERSERRLKQITTDHVDNTIDART